MLYIGCHLSSSGGYTAMVNTAISINANTFQFFTRNPRGGAAKAIVPQDAAEAVALMKERGFGKIVAHAPYTLNLCSANPQTREFALATIKDDLSRMEYTPGNLYNFHPGSHTGQGVEVGIGQIADSLNAALRPEQTTKVLLEGMAGKGSEIGGNFAELRAILDRVELSDKVGVCLDTCHAYDAGYDVRDDFEGVLEELDKAVGIEKLGAVHINDDMFGFASHKDRHQKIGLGSIGAEAFGRIINNPALKGLPMILETPNELEGYANEIKLLKSMEMCDII